ncbi:MAG: hypothetical protein LAT76_09645 [Schleiferiaceae bacterium]|nr:hypothetical protein [Schleiferiaceae bacterium]
MEPKISKLAKIVSAIVMIIGAILTLVLFYEGDAAIIEDSEKTNPLFFLSYLAFFTAVGAVLFSSIGGLLKSPGALKRSLIGLGALVLIFIIAYALSSGADYTNYAKFEITEETSKWVSTGLNMFYITGLLAIASLVWSSFGRIVK